MQDMAFFHSNFMLQSSHEDDDLTHPSASLAPILTPCAAQEFQGVGSLFGKRPLIAFSTGIHVCEEMNTSNNTHHNYGEDELSDDGSQIGEKKRRLNMEQVKTLEKNFELGNKLEPERKMQLARDLGLQPRQIAIWFQNRRARWKTKQLEKDYDLLKRQLEDAKAENDALHSKNKKLRAEILALKTREPTESINLNKETEGSCSNRSENSSEIRLEISRTAAIDSPFNAHEARPGPFPFPSSHVRHIGVAVTHHHLLHTSSRPEIHGPKMDQVVKDESSFCNMFCGIDDQTGFWPWLEQHNFG